MEISAISDLTKRYRQLKPDLVHHHTIKPVLYGGIAAQRAKVPSVVASITGRGYAFSAQDSRSKMIENIVRPVYRRVLQSENTQIIFENSSDREFFLNTGISQPGQTHLIESVGVDPDLFSSMPEPDEPPVIVMVSRMLWDKGVGILVDAARLLQKKNVDFKLELVGDIDPGNPTSIPETQLRDWQEDGILEWSGWQSDMQHVYARSRIVTLPSFHEGVPTALLEAAACGRPIVASDIPGCRIAVLDGKSGLLVEPRQPVPLAAALEKLILNPDLRGRMGRAGREHILSKFTQQQINQQTLQVYRQALSG